MQRKTFSGAIALALSLLAPVAVSASAQTAEETEATAENQAVKAEPVSVKTTEKPAKAAAKKTPRIKAQSAQSADKYEASEEISEDLSVSYPVDI
ncbi:hypothetical protein [uncultured Microbulbifer sp.]|uniref:hypothetical protein n=1 Tax=uncultured Microbulbifer sp. TaxID=348147 RepID=UPI00260C15A9|nr:hypothetical protein [uncultured Microbulbifer sp.]